MLEEKFAGAAASMQQAAWMAGNWDVVETTFRTPTTPEPTARGTRGVAFELDGWALFARQTAGPMKTLSVLVYDP